MSRLQRMARVAEGEEKRRITIDIRRLEQKALYL